MTERQGKYIVIEGHDGTGKSTQVRLVRERLHEWGIESIEFHEPEGNPIADEIRTIIKNGNLERTPETNLLLFTAARREIWQQRAAPALALGRYVVAARNYYSTIAYQGHGEGLDISLITSTTAAFTDERYRHPDIAIILTLDDNTQRQERIDMRGQFDNPDTFESKDAAFQRRVHEGYVQLAADYNLPTIPADGTPHDVTDRIMSHFTAPN